MTLTEEREKTLHYLEGYIVALHSVERSHPTPLVRLKIAEVQEFRIHLREELGENFEEEDNEQRT